MVEDIIEDGDLDIVIGTGFLTCNFLERQNHLGEIEPPQPCGGLVGTNKRMVLLARRFGTNLGLFYHRVLFTDLDNDGIKDMIAVGENRPARRIWRYC